MGDIIKNLKEFIWDIIGYMIPGFLFIIIFNLVINPSVGIRNNFLFDWKLFNFYLIILASYILGYMIYSITIFKIRNQDYIILKLEKYFIKWFLKNEKDQDKIISKNKKFNTYIKSKHSKFWEISFKESATISSARKFLEDNGYADVDKMKLNEIRNILMSRNPKMDEKVYTFMFRSSVFDHVSTIFMLTCILALIQVFLNYFNFDIHFIKTENNFLVLYISLLCLIPLLGNSKRMFYSISQRIPNSNLK